MRNTALVMFAVLAASGCATVISTTSQAVMIDSNVKGANVALNGNLVGVTPYSGKIPRKREMMAVVSKDGYDAQHLNLTTTFNPIAVLNIFWDLSTTDCITGACWEYAPNSYYVNLKEAAKNASTFRRQSELMAFAMTYYSDLAREIAAGSGPRTDALASTFFEGRKTSSELLEAMETIDRGSNGNIVTFGEAVGALLATSP